MTATGNVGDGDAIISEVRWCLTPETLRVFGVGPRCRPLATKIRDFGGTPLSTEWFTHLPTKLGLPSVRWPQYKKEWIPRSTLNGVGIYTFLQR